MSTTYFSERERGPRPRMAEAISQPVRRALLRQIQLGIGNGSYGWRFPEQCGDERGACGTDERAFWDTAAAEVPDLLLPENASLEQALRCADDVDTVVFLDLLEFCARAVARPVQRDYHSYYHHLGYEDFRMGIINRGTGRLGALACLTTLIYPGLLISQGCIQAEPDFPAYAR